MTGPTLLVEAASLRAEPGPFFEELRARLGAGARTIALYGQPAEDPDSLALTALLEQDAGLAALRCEVRRAEGFASLTRDLRALHVFEREIFEQFGVRPHGHPWLKPVRFPGRDPGAMDRYPFYAIEGKEVHEVAVGPIHAGVIEPGHFRFQCLGEQVHHLEIQLGYQHRGVEQLLLRGDPRRLTPLVETISGDATAAHAWAHCAALEALSGTPPSPEREASRGLALELERIGMHLAGLAGMATDIAFLQGGATYGRLRTTIINTTMLLCGSRFSRGWLRPGSLPVGWTAETAEAVRSNLALVRRDLAIVNRRFLTAKSVRLRLVDVGTVTRAQSLEVGLVGAAARASGVDLDLRMRLPGELYRELPVASIVETSGDCWARGMVRVREIDRSIEWILAALARHPVVSPEPLAQGPLAGGRLEPGRVAFALREGWRGEVLHALETDGAGRLRSYRVQDPSLRNWLGLALALRGNEISDFPICNKSFDLSYCGHDL